MSAEAVQQGVEDAAFLTVGGDTYPSYRELFQIDVMTKE
jgi:hypothetical protein